MSKLKELGINKATLTTIMLTKEVGNDKFNETYLE